MRNKTLRELTFRVTILHTTAIRIPLANIENDMLSRCRARDSAQKAPRPKRARASTKTHSHYYIQIRATLRAIVSARQPAREVNLNIIPNCFLIVPIADSGPQKLSRTIHAFGRSNRVERFGYARFRRGGCPPSDE